MNSLYINLAVVLVFGILSGYEIRKIYKKIDEKEPTKEEKETRERMILAINANRQSVANLEDDIQKLNKTISDSGFNSKQSTRLLNSVMNLKFELNEVLQKCEKKTFRNSLAKPTKFTGRLSSNYAKAKDLVGIASESIK